MGKKPATTVQVDAYKKESISPKLKTYQSQFYNVVLPLFSFPYFQKRDSIPIDRKSDKMLIFL